MERTVACFSVVKSPGTIGCDRDVRSLLTASYATSPIILCNKERNQATSKSRSISYDLYRRRSRSRVYLPESLGSWTTARVHHLALFCFSFLRLLARIIVSSLFSI
jgi:hypothetical protein